MSDLIRREDALRVTLAYASIYRAEEAETALLALIDKPAVQPHVNETQKSEHDAANVLTPATKGGA